MQPPMRVGILTSREIRHRYFVNALRRRLPVVAVAYEDTGYAPAGVAIEDLSSEERQIVSRHFEERTAEESRFFGYDAEFVLPSECGCSIEHLPPGSSNSPQTVAFFEDGGADTLAVFGANLIKDPLLERWSGRIVNLHLGLSPYYRGTATNFYPLLNDEPEYVGATIHAIDRGIDSGPIFRHARPEITDGDRPHTIGCKAIQAGVAAMIAVLSTMERGAVAPVPQWNPPHARLYLRKDYHPRQVVELYRKWDAGLLERYLERMDRVRRRVYLIE